MANNPAGAARAAAVAPRGAPSAADIRHPHYQTIKAKVHQELLNRLNLERLARISRDQAEPEIRTLILGLLETETKTTPLSLYERESMTVDVLDELFGLGPLEALLKDPNVSDILVNRFNHVYVEREGKHRGVHRGLPRRQAPDADHRAHRQLGRSPHRRVEPDGRRAAGRRLARQRHHPAARLDGPCLSIRRFRTDRLGSADLVDRQALTRPMLDFLVAAVASRLNIIVCGGTGAGKTTLLNVLSGFISEGERIITIEDAAELMLRQRHVVRLETRPPNIEGKGAVKQRDLVINALRMRPDRIIVGEVRGAEALDMLQAMNTGHDGSLTTIHANSPRDALYRLDTMVAMASLQLPDRAVRQQIASAVDLIVQISRLSDGTRRVTAISELTGMENDVITMQDIFVFERTGVAPNGKVVGRFRATGIRPKCSDRLAASGRPLAAGMFEHVQQVA